MGRVSLEGEHNGVMYRLLKDVDISFIARFEASVPVIGYCKDCTH